MCGLLSLRLYLWGKHPHRLAPRQTNSSLVPVVLFQLFHIALVWIITKIKNSTARSAYVAAKQICVPQYMHTKEGKKKRKQEKTSPQKSQKAHSYTKKVCRPTGLYCLFFFFSSLPDSCGFSREEERETDKVELEEEEELCIRAEQHWPVLRSLGDSRQLRWEHWPWQRLQCFLVSGTNKCRIEVSAAHKWFMDMSQKENTSAR